MEWIALNDTLSDAVVVRRFIDVLSRAPFARLVEGVGIPDPATIDRLLGAEACDALAMRLIGEDSGFFASRGGSGDYLVSVVLGGVEMTAAGATLTRAMVCALALILSQPDAGRHDGPVEHGFTGLLCAPSAGATLH